MAAPPPYYGNPPPTYQQPTTPPQQVYASPQPVYYGPPLPPAPPPAPIAEYTQQPTTAITQSPFGYAVSETSSLIQGDVRDY